jgi:hypothetical protein
MSTSEEVLYAALLLQVREARRLSCAVCGRRTLVLVDEEPDPNFGLLGVTKQKWKCDSLECGAILIV